MLQRNLFLKIFILLLVLAPVIAPAVVLAQAYQTPNIWKVPPGYWGPIVSCSGNYLAANSAGGGAASSGGTCQSLCDLINTATNAVYLAMSVALFIIAPVLLVVGGLMIMVSGANPEMLTKGKKALLDTVIGIVIVLCSYLIVNTVITALQISGVGGFGASLCTIVAPPPTTDSTGSASPADSTSVPAGGACTNADQCASGVCVTTADGNSSCASPASSNSGIQSPGEGVVGGVLNPGWIPCGNTQCNPASRFPNCAINKDGSKYCSS